MCLPSDELVGSLIFTGDERDLVGPQTNLVPDAPFVLEIIVIGCSIENKDSTWKENISYLLFQNLTW